VTTSYAPPPDQDQRRYPASAIEGATEAFVIFDDVFVPWERVFLAGEVEHSATFAHSLGLWERQGALAMQVEVADTLVGLAQLIAEANGIQRISHIRDKIGEMIVYATLLRSSLDSAISKAEITPEGWASPDELATNAAKYYAAAEYSRMVRHLHDIAGGSTLTTPGLDDLENPDVGVLVEKYMRTRPEISGERRIRLFHAIRDMTGDGLGTWRNITYLHAGGGLYAQLLVSMKHYDMDRARALASRVARLDEAPGYPEEAR
jgi:4-hydroxybutyryl-CoA dehydratase/vinylacetyl-CoA-Delta-isomerase